MPLYTGKVKRKPGSTGRKSMRRKTRKSLKKPDALGVKHRPTVIGMQHSDGPINSARIRGLEYTRIIWFMLSLSVTSSELWFVFACCQPEIAVWHPIPCCHPSKLNRQVGHATAVNRRQNHEMPPQFLSILLHHPPVQDPATGLFWFLWLQINAVIYSVKTNLTSVCVCVCVCVCVKAETNRAKSRLQWCPPCGSRILQEPSGSVAHWWWLQRPDCRIPWEDSLLPCQTHHGSFGQSHWVI